MTRARVSGPGVTGGCAPHARRAARRAAATRWLDAVVPCLAGFVLAAAAAPSSAQPSEIETYHVQGNVYLLAGAAANVAVQIGDDGVLVVDPAGRGTGDAVLAAIRRLSNGPIRWIVNTASDLEHTGANGLVSQAGMTVNGNPAAIMAHEGTLTRMATSNRPVTELPLDSFFEQRRDFYFNGEAIFLEHVPPAHTDGDIFVYFRDSDVVVAGDVFLTTHYPVIDLDAGGGVDGFVAGLNRLLDITVPAWLQEGGTYVIPGHGRIGDEADVLEYRDMVVILRDRIRALADEGMSLRQIMATRPTLDYDTRYDRVEGAGSAAAFVEAVYRDYEMHGGGQ